ncbi:MAG TPA: hypothetical protein PKH08_01550 [Clostridia bacterium]|nr:hypothetical protein [Clostridia bacterium]
MITRRMSAAKITANTVGNWEADLSAAPTKETAAEGVTLRVM